MNQIFWVLAIALMILAACNSPDKVKPMQFPTNPSPVQVSNPQVLVPRASNPIIEPSLSTSPPTVNIGSKVFQVEIVSTEPDRIKGLSGHAKLNDDQGMLFIFPTSSLVAFWMKDMLFPLDIAFIDSEGVIVDIKRDFQPCTPGDAICPAYGPTIASKYVLEVNAGQLKDAMPGQSIVIAGLPGDLQIN